MIPEYDVVVIDEAHELTSRITQAATDELMAADVDRAAKRSQRHVEGDQANDLADAGDVLRVAMGNTAFGRIDAVPDELKDALVLVRDAARACLSAYPRSDSSGEADPGLTQAKGSVQELFAIADRMAAFSEADVLWLNEGGDRIPPRLCVAPLQVWGPMRDKLLTRQGRGVHQRDAAARRRLQHRRVELRSQDERAGPRARRVPSGPRTSCPGAASTSAARSTTASRPSSTSPRTCRRRAATASATPSSTRSSSSSTPPTAGPSACSRAGAPPRPRPRRSASGCRT